MNPRRLAFPLLLALAMTGLLLLHWSNHNSGRLRDWKTIQRLWQRGDLVLLIRHATRCDRSEEDCLTGNNGITLPGAFLEDSVGYDIQDHLDLTRAQIYHSPVKRTVQTAAYLFHGASRKAAWLRKGCKQHLLQEILAHKRKGINLILVTHASCMKHLGEAEGKPLIDDEILQGDSYGITWFLAVDDAPPGLRSLGYLMPEDWERR